MTEKFTLQQILGQGRTVDRNKGLVLAGAVHMDSLGHQFLAGSTLAGNQDRGGGGGHLFDQLIDLNHARILANHPGKARPGQNGLPQADIFTNQGIMLDRLVNRDNQFVVGKGLGQIIKGAGLHGGYRLINLGKGGNHDHRQITIYFLDGLEELQAIHTRHLHVGDHQVEIHIFHQGQSLIASGSGKDLKSLVTQQLGKNDQIVWFIINDQYGMHNQLSRYGFDMVS